MTLERGVVKLSPRPTPTPSPIFIPPTPTFVHGNITIDEKAPEPGTRFYARVRNAALGDEWMMGITKENGVYSMHIGVTHGAYTNSPVEFYLEGLKSVQGTKLIAAGDITLNLTFFTS